MIKRFEGQREERRVEDGAGVNTVWAEQTAIEKEELIKIQIP